MKFEQEFRGRYRVLFIGYWNADDGLTSSTIIPHLRILRSLGNVEALYFTNVQREAVSVDRKSELNELTDGYFPLYSKNLKNNFLNKISDFIRFPTAIYKICTTCQINLIIARGTPAGALAWKTWRKTTIPYIVESFEPHANYMRYSGTWGLYDLRYLFQSYWEKQQKRTAKALVTVSYNYKQNLVEEGVLETKVAVAPCAVSSERFFPDTKLREAGRKELGIPKEAIVGVYAGKFGGLYLGNEAFELFKVCFDEFESFHLLLLSSDDSQWVTEQVKKYKLPESKVFQRFLSHFEVNKYLNIADFGFALYKSNEVSLYLSPVKVGEYWAVGLPVLATDRLGDESSFIENEEMGLTVNINSRREMKKAINKLETYFGKFQSAKIRKKGLDFRSFEQVRKIYRSFV
jgi:glycosyltransferase involved in cell wall biosynthesis